MQRNITIFNRKQVRVTYELKDDHVVPPQNNETLANGVLDVGQSKALVVSTYSNTPGDTHYYYNYMRADDGVWHGWTGASSHNGVVDLV
jgi:hypothetical protein